MNYSIQMTTLTEVFEQVGGAAGQTGNTAGQTIGRSDEDRESSATADVTGESRLPRSNTTPTSACSRGDVSDLEDSLTDVSFSPHERGTEESAKEVAAARRKS